MTSQPAIVAALASQAIELPSWAFGNSGTRFKVFAQAGVPRDPYEKIADAAQVHRYTGVAPTVALHIPWDKVDDYGDLARHAGDCGVALGTINSNTFQDNDYMLGSVCHPDARVRRKAVDHLLECIDIMDATGSRDLKLWFADGTNYPGQDDIRARQDRLAESLATRLRPARAGPADRAGVQALRAVVLHDGRAGLGHGARSLPRARDPRPRSSSTPATTRRAPTSSSSSPLLLRADKLGAFDFNSRFYADDDLMVGAADPFQLFRIMHEVVKAGALDPEVGVAFMLDQCHNIEPKIPGQIRSVMNVQEATAKALLVDQAALEAAQAAGDVLGANARADGRLRHRRAAAACRTCAEGWASIPTRWRAYARSGYAAADRRGTRRRPAGGLGRMTHGSRPGRARRRPRADRPRSCSTGPTGSGRIRATRTMPAATPRPRARRSTRSRARPSSCCGSRAPAATSGR